MIWATMNTIRFASLSLYGVIGNNPQNLDLTSINGILQTAINWGTGLSGTVALIYLVYGGIQYMTSPGNSKQTETAKATITWAIIGLVVIISAWAIVQYFLKLLGTQ